jgi:7,8-dihydroneopterin aldolase/epimerase/oxygenase
MDKIFLAELKVEAIIGYYDWERQVKQAVLIDLEFATDVAAAAGHDDINRTTNYKNIAKRTLAFVGESKFHLLETLAEQLAKLLVREFDLAWIKITVHKPGAIRSSRDVGVVIERRRDNYPPTAS